MQLIKATRRMRRGALLLHATATVAGVTARIDQPRAIRRMQALKQRPGPFLLLASSIPRALSLASYPTTALRQLAYAEWPGAVTLVFPARSGLPRCCYQGSCVAVRVDAAPAVRQLAARNQGLILSSSFNRRGRPTGSADFRSRYRMGAWIDGRIEADTESRGQPSSLYKVRGNKIKQLR